MDNNDSEVKVGRGQGSTAPGEGITGAMSLPQRILMKYAADAIGAQGDIGSSEKSAQNIIEKAAEKVHDVTGLDTENPMANAAKALGVAALEVYGDPTQLLPVNKLAKGAKSAAKAIGLGEKLQELQRAAPILGLGPKVDKVAEAMKNVKLFGAKTLEEAKQVEQAMVQSKPQITDKIRAMAEQVKQARAADSAAKIPVKIKGPISTETLDKMDKKGFIAILTDAAEKP